LWKGLRDYEENKKFGRISRTEKVEKDIPKRKSIKRYPKTEEV